MDQGREGEKVREKRKKIRNKGESQNGFGVEGE